MPNVTGQGTRHLVEGTLEPLVRRFHLECDEFSRNLISGGIIYKGKPDVVVGPYRDSIVEVGHGDNSYFTKQGAARPVPIGFLYSGCEDAPLSSNIGHLVSMRIYRLLGYYFASGIKLNCQN